MSVARRIIAFGHRSRVGKDTAAKFALQLLRIQRSDLRIEKRSFAWRLKEHCHDLFAWAGVREPAYYEHNPEARDIPLEMLGRGPNYTVVDLWIEYGQKCREIFDDVWARQVLHTNCDVLIIPDMRFPNEASLIRELSEESILVKINRKSAPIRDSKSDAALDDFDDWDAIIDNDEGQNTLHECVDLLTRGFLNDWS